MTDLSSKTVLVWDFGNYIEVAQRLSRDFGRVYYYCPYVINGYPEHDPFDIGRNVEGIIKVHDWADYFEETDLFVFPDQYEGGLQEFLRRLGKPVYGSGKGGQIETDRLGLKKIMEEIGLPVNEYDVAKGVYELENKLKNIEDKYIKSSLRGDCETFHHINYLLSKDELKRMKHEMGVFDKQETYLIESPIDAIGEIGYDGWCIDGAYPKKSVCGIEIKDAGYLGKFINYNELPKQIRLVNDKLAPIFQNYGYRGAFSSEVRVDKKGTGYLIDATCRSPQPNTSLAVEMYDNFSEIIWDVANGIVPEIKYKYEWGVQLIIKSEMAKTEPICLQFPEIYKNNIKIKNLVIDDNGSYYYTPNGVPMCEIGAVIGMGKSMDDAIKMATEIADTVKGFDIKIGKDCIDSVKKDITNLKKNGIYFL